MRVVVPDELFQLNIEGEGETHHYMVGAKYDRIDLVRPLGHWMLKVFDDEKGLVTMHIDEATARRVAEFAFLPICERDTITESEFQGYLVAAEKMMDRWDDV